MRTLEPYPEYKDSGIPWLSQMPAHWNPMKMKFLFRERSEKGFPNEPALAATQTKGVVKKELFENRTVLALDNLHLLKLVEIGDFVISLRSFQGGIEYAHHRGIISPAYTVLTLRKEAVSMYFAWLFKSKPYIQNLSLFVTGIRQGQNIDYEKLSRSFLPVPDHAKQQQIAAFLTHFDRQINRLIRTKQQMIELLNEQKQAIIQQAVTRGLDPNVRLKPSGIDWLGDVPEHWEVTKLYRITDPKRPIMYGIVLPGPNVEQGVYIVKGGNCEPGRLRPEFLSRTTFEIESHYLRSRLRAKDIVYSIRGSIGAAELVPSELEGANLTQDAARIAPGSAILPKWLLYAVRSPSFFRKLDAGALGAAVRGINVRDLKRADLIVPPLEEQACIASFLDEETSSMGEACERAFHEIGLLREYRTRLIADVVTGKLDVRGVDLPEIDDMDSLDILEDLESEEIDHYEEVIDDND